MEGLDCLEPWMSMSMSVSMSMSMVGLEKGLTWEQVVAYEVDGRAL